MSLTIAAQHFELSPSVRSVVVRSAQKLQPHLPPEARMRVSVKSRADRGFDARFRVVAYGEEWVAEDSDENFFVALNCARDRLARVLGRMKGRRHHRLRKEG